MDTIAYVRLASGEIRVAYMRFHTLVAPPLYNYDDAPALLRDGIEPVLERFNENMQTKYSDYEQVEIWCSSIHGTVACDALYAPEDDLLLTGHDPFGRQAPEAQQLDLRSEIPDWVPHEVRPEYHTTASGVRAVRSLGGLPRTSPAGPHIGS
jgi:hypothetical protein